MKASAFGVGPPVGRTHPCTPEGVKKLNDLGSPRPNEGEGLRGEGGGTCRIEPRGEAEEALQMRNDSARRGSTAIPLTPQPLSPLGRGEPQSNLISILHTFPPTEGNRTYFSALW